MAGVALLCACHKSENEQIFDKLDRVIAKKYLYEERFVRHADSLRRELRAAGDDTLRWQTANRLFDSYITYNIDTAARYAGLMHNYADATGSREMKFLSTTCDVSVLIAATTSKRPTNGSFPSIRSASPGGCGPAIIPSRWWSSAARLGRRVGGAAEGLCRFAFQAPPHTDRFRRPLPCHAAADVCPRTDGSEPL